MSRIRRRPVSSFPSLPFVFAALAGSALGASCVDASQCLRGTEACACAQGAVCLDGLKCLSGYCVDPDWEPPANMPAGEGPAADGPGGGASTNNVEACHALVEELSCGGFDFSQVLNCNLYVDVSCSVSDYFDCIRDVVVCSGGVADASAIVECTDLAACD